MRVAEKGREGVHAGTRQWTMRGGCGGGRQRHAHLHTNRKKPTSLRGRLQKALGGLHKSSKVLRIVCRAHERN